MQTCVQVFGGGAESVVAHDCPQDALHTRIQWWALWEFLSFLPPPLSFADKAPVPTRVVLNA